MTQAPAMLKSMIDSIEGDINGVSATQAQLVEFLRDQFVAQGARYNPEDPQTMCGGNQTKVGRKMER
jgi:hypothetical protein